jgi:hypothetical protein
VSCGIILASLVIASDESLQPYAPWAASTTALYIAAFVCGFLIAFALDNVRWILYAVGLMALFSVLIYSAVLIITGLQVLQIGFDILMLMVLSQSLLRFIVLGVFSLIGAGMAIQAKVIMDRLMS